MGFTLKHLKTRFAHQSCSELVSNRKTATSERIATHAPDCEQVFQAHWPLMRATALGCQRSYSALTNFANRSSR